jgi:hypothetical protein
LKVAGCWLPVVGKDNGKDEIQGYFGIDKLRVRMTTYNKQARGRAEEGSWDIQQQEVRRGRNHCRA